MLRSFLPSFSFHLKWNSGAANLASSSIPVLTFHIREDFEANRNPNSRPHRGRDSTQRAPQGRRHTTPEAHPPRLQALSPDNVRCQDSQPTQVFPDPDGNSRAQRGLHRLFLGPQTQHLPRRPIPWCREAPQHLDQEKEKAEVRAYMRAIRDELLKPQPG